MRTAPSCQVCTRRKESSEKVDLSVPTKPMPLDCIAESMMTGYLYQMESLLRILRCVGCKILEVSAYHRPYSSAVRRRSWSILFHPSAPISAHHPSSCSSLVTMTCSMGMLIPFLSRISSCTSLKIHPYLRFFVLLKTNWKDLLHTSSYGRDRGKTIFWFFRVPTPF